MDESAIRDEVFMKFIDIAKRIAGEPAIEGLKEVGQTTSEQTIKKMVATGRGRHCCDNATQPLVDDDGNLHTEPMKLLKIWAKHFQEVFEDDKYKDGAHFPKDIENYI